MARAASIAVGFALACAGVVCGSPAPAPALVLGSPVPALAQGAPDVRAGVTSQAVVDGGLPQPLTSQAGDASRGQAIVANRQLGLCLLCHSAPIANAPFQGNLSPSLAGAGARWTSAQLRLRLVDPRLLNPQTVMPAYFSTTGLVRVAPAQAGKTILSAQELEDVVAYLGTL